MKQEAQPMRASDIAQKVGQGMKTNNVFSLMKNRRPLKRIPKKKEDDGRVFFNMRPRDIETINELWQEMRELRKSLSAQQVALWLISKQCPICPDDLTRLARQGKIPAKKIGRRWGFSSQDKKTILKEIKNR